VVHLSGAPLLQSFALKPAPVLTFSIHEALDGASSDLFACDMRLRPRLRQQCGFFSRAYSGRLHVLSGGDLARDHVCAAIRRDLHLVSPSASSCSHGNRELSGVLSLYRLLWLSFACIPHDGKASVRDHHHPAIFCC